MGICERNLQILKFNFALASAHIREHFTLNSRIKRVERHVRSRTGHEKTSPGRIAEGTEFCALLCAFVEDIHLTAANVLNSFLSYCWIYRPCGALANEFCILS